MNETDLHRVVVTAILYRHRPGTFQCEYLIVKRADHLKFAPGRWTVPGGGLQRSDYQTPDKDEWYHVLSVALERELREEIGSDMRWDTPELLCDLVFLRPDDVAVLTLSHHAEWLSGEPMLNDENSEFAWVTLEEIKGYDLLPDIPAEISWVDLGIDTGFIGPKAVR